jgi:hypothetical protein
MAFALGIERFGGAVSLTLEGVEVGESAEQVRHMKFTAELAQDSEKRSPYLKGDDPRCSGEYLCNHASITRPSVCDISCEMHRA